jgi:hypothetical protein
VIIVVVSVTARTIGELEPLRDIQVEDASTELGFAVVCSLHVEITCWWQHARGIDGTKVASSLTLKLHVIAPDTSIAG